MLLNSLKGIVSQAHDQETISCHDDVNGRFPSFQHKTPEKQLIFTLMRASLSASKASSSSLIRIWNENENKIIERKKTLFRDRWLEHLHFSVSACFFLSSFSVAWVSVNENVASLWTACEYHQTELQVRDKRPWVRNFLSLCLQQIHCS